MTCYGNSKKLRHVFALGAAAALLSSCAMAPTAPEKIFETNVTNDLNQSSGEPEIAVDPKNPRHLAIIEFGLGSAEAPAAVFNPQIDHDPVKTLAASKNGGRVMMSTDGGDHWAFAGSPASRPNSPSKGGGDPMIAIGPDGTIYAADEAGPAPDAPVNSAPVPGLPAGFPDLSGFGILIAVSTDGGKTFAAPQVAPTPVDRPWMTVDQSTGMVYTVSSGLLDLKTGKHNLPGPGVINDRWLVAWQPHLTGRSEPHRIGGPDFSGSGGNTITAAHGAIAATFVLGGAAPGGFAGNPPKPTPVPDSLKSIMKGGVTECSMQAPCLYFETSTDQGAHWSRHHVVVPGGFSAGGSAHVSADPGHAGRFAIAVLNPTKTNFLVLVTNDSGATWSGPVTVAETAQGVDFKQWMAYGPTGVLGLTWRKERSDLPAPKPTQPQGPMEALFNGRSPGYDVYVGISCDGGATWLPPVRVNAEASLAGPVGRDDLNYIALDGQYAHAVWGDRRLVEKVHNSPTGMGGIQAFYGRVPFSTVSNGAACGRK